MGSGDNFCWQCGALLIQQCTFGELWLVGLRCSSPECDTRYLKLLDMRNDYPPAETFPTVLEKLSAAITQDVEKCRSKIKEVDYKTISIVELERFVLGHEE